MSKATNGNNLQQMIMKQVKNCRYCRTEDLGVENLEAFGSTNIRTPVTLKSRQHASCCIRLHTKKISTTPYYVWESNLMPLTIYLQLSNQHWFDMPRFSFDDLRSWHFCCESLSLGLWTRNLDLGFRTFPSKTLYSWIWTLSLLIVVLWVLHRKSSMFLQSQIQNLKLHLTLVVGLNLARLKL